MSLQSTPRPWYCLDALVEDYLTVASTGGDLYVIKTIKAIQTLVANVGAIAIGVLALLYGADPTIVGSTAMITLGLLNGALALDYAAVARAVVELSEEAVDEPSGED